MKSILVTTREEKQKAVDRLIELGFESPVMEIMVTTVSIFIMWVNLLGGLLL